MRYKYYEEGSRKIFSMRKLYRFFSVNVSDEEKDQGTTFTSWIDEMIRLQILNKQGAMV